MVLSVATYRGLYIDMSKLELGDVLLVELERGTVILLPIRERSSLRLMYANRSWLPDDAAYIKKLRRDNANITAFDGFGSLANGHVSVYVPRDLRLDVPLHCTAEIHWESDAKNRERSRELSRFDSTGGPIRSVTPARLPLPSRS